MNHRTIRSLRTKLAYRIAPWLKPRPFGIQDTTAYTSGNYGAHYRIYFNQ